MSEEILPHTRWGDECINTTERSLPALKAQWVLNHIPRSERPLRILDYGCGEGKLLRTIEHQFSSHILFGTDIRSPHNHEGYQFLTLEEAQQEHWKEQFDIITCIDVLEHVLDPNYSLSHITSLLKPGGCALLFIPVEGRLSSPHRLYRLLLGDDLYVKTKDHIQAYRIKPLFNTIGQYFTIRSVIYSYHMLGSWMDASFFALHVIPSVSRWWWNANPYYRPHAKPSLAGRLLQWANMLCYYESRLLSRCSWGASCVHVVAIKDKK